MNTEERIQKFRQIFWAQTHRDYKGIVNGVKYCVYRSLSGKTRLASLETIPLHFILEFLGVGRKINRLPLATTERLFIEDYPGDLPGVSVTACVLLASTPDGIRFAIGGESPYVWRTVKERRAQVDDILYAGDDVNIAHAVRDDANREILREKFLQYAVEAESVADFLDRYYRPERYSGRGDEYATGLLASYEKNFKKNGYCFISHHDSITGRIVSWFGPPRQ